MHRVRRTKLILWLLTGFSFPIFGFRFLRGLGASTHLTDAQPWGMWIGFDLLSGVALAAGGFVICTFAYVVKKDAYLPMVRPAVLTAFLGYLAFVVGLLVDVGLPWTIWHVTIHWNLQSALFEVAWCVMLYTTVLALEFLPVPLESTSRFAKVRSFLIKIRLPLVILGIMLSTLHQSSLGSLFLIMPHRVHPLWYSPLIPLLFFLSAIGLGLMVVTFEGLVSHTLYLRGPQAELYEKLGNMARWVLGVVFVLRIADLIVRGQSSFLFVWDWRTLVFWLEVSLSAIVPILLLSVPSLRGSLRGQWIISTMVIVGIVWNRMNVGGFTHIDRGAGFYVPAWTEVVMSIGIVAAFGLVFLFSVERFNIWEERPKDPMTDPEARPDFDPVSRVWLGEPSHAGRMKHSLAFVVAAALGIAAISTVAATGMRPEPANPARGELAGLLLIDGNHDGFGTIFPHRMHEERNGGAESCVLCHHMRLPRDKHSPCAACHRDMYQPTDAFKHDWHASPEGGNLGCNQCHPTFKAKQKETAAQCDVCHNDLLPEGAKSAGMQYRAPSYTDAMHLRCIACHKEKAAAIERPGLSYCGNCHREIRPFIDHEGLAKRQRRLTGKAVVLPPIGERHGK